MKKILAIILSIILIVSVLPMGLFNITASAEYIEYTKGYYTYSVYDDKATIVDVDTSISGNITIPSTLGGYKVTRIGTKSFEYCTDLTSVTIPDSITSIGEYAFYGCTELSDFSFGNQIQLIEYKALHNTGWYNSHPDGLVYVGKILYKCKNVCPESVTITDGTIAISGYAFSGYNSLKNVSIPNSVVNIEREAFRNCRGLTNIFIPSSVEKIGLWAFEGCAGLASVVFTEGLQELKIGAFKNCSSLSSVTIPNSVTTISSETFQNCTGLRSVTIGEKVTYIDGGTFANCTNLETVNFNAINCLTMGSGGISINGHTIAFENCDNIRMVNLGENIKNIPEGAFRECVGIEYITIPKSVTNIGALAFKDCDSLKSVYYRGSEDDKAKIKIASNNSDLTNAVWYYNSCIDASEHIYDNVCDASCNLCDYKRSPHAYKTEWEKDASQHWHECSVCGDKKDISLHDFEWVIDKANNCGEDGIKHEKCTICNTIRNENTAILATGNHEYDNACDASCNVCGFVRNVLDHSYTLNGNHTCSICKYSKTPDKPVVESKTNNSVTLVKTDGFEYSKDGITWQDSNVFTNLSANTTYTFYQRVKETDIAFESEISEGLSVTFKATQSAPSAPIISSFTDTTVTLMPNANYEYSKDGITWQTSNVFTALLSGTKYTFYQRYAETDTHEASNKSAGTSITTDKAEQLLIPNAPTLQSFTTNSITLTPVDGCEYSKNGTTWQSSNVFSGLNCGTEYTFYQRYKETDTTYVGETSAAFVAKTDKGTQTAPSAPTLESKTHNTVTLTAVSGYEYSRDGINWQSSNVFTDLDSKTNYMFYQRKAETETHYAGPASTYLIVKTSEAPKYTPGDINDSGAEPDLDDVVALAQVVAGWQNVAHNTEALDVNRDGAVTLDDVVLLAQFVAGWDVTLS